MARGKELKARAEASTDVAEVRSIHAQLAELDADIEEIREEIAIIDEELRADEQPAPEEREQVPEEAETRNSNCRPRSEQRPQPQNREIQQPTETMEYRQAFMDFVQHGTPIPAELRAGNAIDTTDTQAAIPAYNCSARSSTPFASAYGNLYRKGQEKAWLYRAAWNFLSVNSKQISVGSQKQQFLPIRNSDKLGKVSFGYHTAEIRIAQTFLSQILTVEDFEAKITGGYCHRIPEALRHRHCCRQRRRSDDRYYQRSPCHQTL